MGLHLLWKERGLGSQDLLGLHKKAQGLPGKGRTGIGHTGTLDPFAEGWLLVGTGEGTKLLSALQGLDKTYEATLFFGATTVPLDDTEDLRWPEDPAWQPFPGSSQPDIEGQLRAFLAQQIGRAEQVPPAHSAVRVEGKRSYEWARAGTPKEMKSRPFEIFETEHLGYRAATQEGRSIGFWRFRVRASAGTYIRSFARDWGLALTGFPGHLVKLVRTEVGGLGRGLPPTAHRLQMQDLQGLMDFGLLNETAAQALRAHGQWHPRPCARSTLLWASEATGVVAYAEAPDGKLGRVFLSDPFRD
jgi:tRNA pseudouridine55 synthase